MFRNNTSRIAAIITLLSTAALPQTGLAASYLDAAQKNTKTSYTVSLADMTQDESLRAARTLDWRQPSVELYFDLPPSERTSEIILNLSADPLTQVDKGTPLQIQFNNGKPVPVLSNGRGFEARLPLDASRSRKRRNVIRITYPTPAGADCVTPAHGAWSIDLSQSKLLLAGRAQNRNMSLAEITTYLEQPALSPKTVGLIAHGPDGTDMQALAAQGVALRTPGVPKFSVTKRNTDFNIVMVKRNRLFDITNDPMILNSKGARIFVPRGKPTDLIFTADTDAEIVRMLELFATRKLPNTRRAISSLGEMDLQTRLDSQNPKVEGKTHLLDLMAASSGNAFGEHIYKFGVFDPLSTEGELLLRLSTAESTSEQSRLSVNLNGKSLGAAKLDKKRKSVAFNIKPSDLKATSNILKLIPEIEAKSDVYCSAFSAPSTGVSIGYGSRLNLNQTTQVASTELSQLTSTGGLFAQHESYIALPRQTREYQAALRILARMAKSAGHGMISADYTRKSDFTNDKHVLIIGPSDMVKNYTPNAPKAFREAMSGQSSTGDNLLQASYERSASIGSDNSDLKYAAAQSAPRKIKQGGVAALYGTGNGTLTGIISAAPGSSFIQASNTLVQPTHWGAIQGGVARWTSSSVVMAQTTQLDKSISEPKPSSRSRFSDFNFSWPEIDWPEFEVPQVSLSQIKWPSFRSSEPVSEIKPPVIERDVVVPKTKPLDLKNSSPTEKVVKVVNITPRLKPAVKLAELRPQESSTGLRGPFQFSVAEKQNRFGSLQDIKRGTEVKWSETKRWMSAQKDKLSDMRTLDDISLATDRFQDRVKPAGRSLKASLKNKLPGKRLVQLGDRTVSVYGLILIMAFIFVLLMMSLASPRSRLGGRH